VEGAQLVLGSPEKKDPRAANLEYGVAARMRDLIFAADALPGP
jgi:hypothetical protein